MVSAAGAGIAFPIIPGIMSITDFGKIRSFAAFCNATIPLWIEKRMETVMDRPEEMRKVGTEIAIEQCRDFLDNGVRYVHFYTMNRADSVAEILLLRALPPEFDGGARMIIRVSPQ